MPVLAAFALTRRKTMHPIEKIAVGKLPDSRAEVPAAQPSGHSSDVLGMLKRDDGPALSIADINALAAAKWAAKR